VPALPGEYGGDTYGGGLYGGGVPSTPTSHVRVVFDADPLVLGGICTGDNSTCESLGDWEVAQSPAVPPVPVVVTGQSHPRRPRTVSPVVHRTSRTANTLTLNDATSRVYAGHHCLMLTSGGAGDLSALIYGLGTVVPGRTYLMWAHVRAEDTPRDCRVVLLWKSATDVFLLADTSASVASSTDDYVRIGVMATCPPGAAMLDIAVDVLDCETGDVHYVDAVTVDYVGTDVTSDVLSGGCTLSGRNHELDRTDSGSLTLTLDNRTGRYTPGATTGADGDPVPAPYLGNMVPRRRVFVLAEYGGVLYPVWSGYTRRIAQEIPGGVGEASTVTVDCDDGFRWLTGTDVPPPYRADVLADGPLSLYPLDEPAGSVSAGDLVFGQPARILSSSTGDGASAFGAATVLPVTLTGSNTDGGSTSLGLNLEQDDLADMGSVLDLRFAGGMPPQLALTDWTMEFWFAFGGPVAPPALAQILFRHLVSSGGADFLSGFQVLLLATGAVQLVTGGSETVATSGVGLADGVGHHVAVTYEDDGSTYGLATLYVDGTEVSDLQLTVEPMVAGLPNNAQLGGGYATVNGAVSFLAQCRFHHVAFYYSRLTAARILVHWQAGALGYYEESDGDRVEAVLRMAGWPDEDTAVDAGLTPLMPREWSATNDLALVQDVCGYSGASPVMDARGAVRVLSRHRFVNEVVVAATFTASTDTEAEHADFAPEVDDSGIANVVEVEQIGGGSIQVDEPASIARYGRIKGDSIPLGASSDAESLTHALWRLSRTAEPLVRVSSATWRPDTAGGALWPLVLSLEFGDRVSLTGLPSTAPADPLDVLVGRVSHTWDSGATWQTTYQLEPALIDQMGVCDHPVYGIADDPLCVAGY
jgi:hypothetical protein